jgi:MFS family permease
MKPVGRIMVGRGLRAFGDGMIAILLPIYLGQLGYSPIGIGVIATTTLLGSALLVLVLGFAAHRVRLRRGLLGAALLMSATGLGFASVQGFWPLLLVAFVGTLNPSGGDVSIFLPLEHTFVAQLVPDHDRTSVYARYSFIGSVGGALGALAVGGLIGLTRFCLPGRLRGSCSFSTAQSAWRRCCSIRGSRTRRRQAHNPPSASAPRAGESTDWPGCSRLTRSAAASS